MTLVWLKGYADKNRDLNIASSQAAPLEQDFKGGNKGLKDSQCTNEGKTGEWEESENGIRECSRECIDTGIKELNELCKVKDVPRKHL